MRIASLIPSGTDLAAALGLGDQLVGVSHECDHLVAIGKPVLTSSVIPPPTEDGPSLPPAEIDRLVVDAVLDGQSLYRTDRALLSSLAPDVVLSQDVCDVCAVNAETAACDLPAGARLVMLTATSIDGLYADLARVGDATGTRDRAEAVIAATRERLAAVARSVAGRRRRRVLALEWGDPPFLGGHWVPELVAVAGGEHALSGAGAPSRRATWEEIAAADPDVVVFMPCGYSLHQAALEAKTLLERPEVAGLRAVREAGLWAVAASELFSRCTPAVAEAAEVLAAIVHGERERVPAGRARLICPAEG